jgi:hypothetical protein
MTTQESKRRSVSIFLFAEAAPAIFAVAIGVVLLLPAGAALPICASLYAIVVLGEARHGTYALQSLVLGGYFAGCALAVAFGMFPDEPVLQRYAAAGGAAAVFFLSLGSMVRGTPLHGRCAEVWEPRAVRRAKAGVWLAVCPPIIVLSLPWVSASWVVAGVQCGLALLGTVAAGVIDFGYCGRRYRRRKEFVLGGFTFREIEREDAMIARFFGSYADEMFAAVSRDRRARVRYSRSEIFEEVSRTERAVTARVLHFNAYDGDKIVGGVAVALDGPDRRLPVEKSLGVTFDPLRRHGRIIEVRRLSVDASYRFQQDIIRGLFKCAIEVALENDVSFMVDLAFHFVVNLLRKAGFEALYVGGREAVEFGSPTQLIALNLAAREYTSPQVVAPQDTPRYAVNQCLRYRYYRRAMIRQAWLSERRPAWSLSSGDMDDLCVPNEGRPSTSGDAERREIARR